MIRRLSEVEVGLPVIICSFENDEVYLKLMEMGLLPGEIVVIDQIAPLGDPISLSISGYHLSLRLNEAELIWVEEIIKEENDIA
jgi:ferrous iron transport protein A